MLFFLQSRREVERGGACLLLPSGPLQALTLPPPSLFGWPLRNAVVILFFGLFRPLKRVDQSCRSVAQTPRMWLVPLLFAVLTQR